MDEKNRTVPQIKVYCLFCSTGHEQEIMRTLETYGFNPVPAFTERIVFRHGVKTREKRVLLPGYVLFEADEITYAHINRLRKCHHFICFLSYSDGEHALRGHDLDFIDWLRGCNGAIDVSKVYLIGNRVKVVSGSLKDYEGYIVDINRKRKCVAIQFGEGNMIKRIWCSVEFLDSDVDKHKLISRVIDGNTEVKHEIS